MINIFKKIKKYSLSLFVSITLILMFIWNYTTPLWDDDSHATHMSLHQILHLSMHEYFTWNGRIVGQTIFRILVNIPISIESILNSVIFVIFLLLILLLSNKKHKPLSTIKYLFITFIAFAFVADFSDIYIWRAGTGNYLWTIVLDLLLILLVKSDLKFNSTVKNVFYIIFLSLLGLVVGNTNENTVGGIIIIFIFYIFFNKLNLKKYIFPLIFTIIGYAILLLSPGEWNRAQIQNPDFLKLNLLEKIKINLNPFFQSLYKYDKYVISLFIILFILNLIFIRNYKLLIEASCWFISGILVLMVLMLSANGPIIMRSHFGAFILMTVANALLFNSSSNDNAFNLINLLIIVILGIGTIYKVSIGFVDCYKTNASINQRNEYILKENKKHSNIIYVKLLKYSGKTKYSIMYNHSDLTNDPNFWVNQSNSYDLRVKPISVHY